MLVSYQRNFTETYPVFQSIFPSTLPLAFSLIHPFYCMSLYEYQSMLSYRLVTFFKNLNSLCNIKRGLLKATVIIHIWKFEFKLVRAQFQESGFVWRKKRLSPNDPAMTINMCQLQRTKVQQGADYLMFPVEHIRERTLKMLALSAGMHIWACAPGAEKTCLYTARWRRHPAETTSTDWDPGKQSLQLNT